MVSYKRCLAKLEKASSIDTNSDTADPPQTILVKCGQEPFDRSKTKIYVGYTVVIGSQHHAFAIAEDPCSNNKYITRAGPSAKGLAPFSGASASSSSGGSSSATSGDGTSGGFDFGKIRAQYGKWTNALAFDRPSDTVKTQYVATVSLSYDEVKKRMREFARITNENEIPYWPLGPNSNTYAFTFVESLGISRPKPALSVPGYDMNKPDDELSYYP